MPDERLMVSSACTACGACLLTCPEHALRPAPGRPRVLDERCTACGECVEVCPADALRLVSASASPTPPGTEPRAW